MRYCYAIVISLLLLVATSAQAIGNDESPDAGSVWFAAPALTPEPAAWQRLERTPVAAPNRRGGEYWHALSFEQGDEPLVLDFANSSVMAYFHHAIFDADGQLVAEFEGGMSHPANQTWFLRHGVDLDLAPGHYQVITRIDTPFFIASPQPMTILLAQYRPDVELANGIVLIGLGIFLGLGFYYLVMGLWRQSPTDLLYAGFIVGNLVYNSAALLVLNSYFGVHWYYWSTAPILISNLLYLFFVFRLLHIRADTCRWLYLLGRGLMIVLVVFWPIALLRPEWSMELARQGVFVFALYGFLAGIVRAIQGDRVARFYLIANVAFLVPAMFAINASQITTSSVWWIEHVGMIAVLVEVLLLAQVMSYRVGLVHQGRLKAESDLQRAKVLAEQAQLDPLTELPSRRLLDNRLRQRGGVLSTDKLAMLFIDLDDLKTVNDRFGHRVGDALLVEVAQRIRASLRSTDYAARLGGDEFIITLSPVQNESQVIEVAQKLIAAINQPVQVDEHEVTTGVSVGVAIYPDHTDNLSELIHRADDAMYQAKRSGKNRLHLYEMPHQAQG
ncbi:MAG: diguanylate cyclase [Idiomarina sp.]|nr:diguanylate cyclase [Idiomarina sp.]